MTGNHSDNLIASSYMVPESFAVKRRENDRLLRKCDAYILEGSIRER
jgi:hypothetical protein